MLEVVVACRIGREGGGRIDLNQPSTFATVECRGIPRTGSQRPAKDCTLGGKNKKIAHLDLIRFLTARVTGPMHMAHA